MKEIHGNTLGLKPSELKKLRNTFRRRTAASELVSAELARHLSELSREIRRQVGVLIDRRGEVTHVMVGDAHRLELPDIGRARAGSARLRGLRLVHTHLESEPLTRDDLTDLALLRLDWVVAVGVLDDGLPGVLHTAHLLPENPGGALWRLETLPSVHVEGPDAVGVVTELEAELSRTVAVRKVGGRERAILVGTAIGVSRLSAEASLDELTELARTAGVEVIDRVVQSRREPDGRYLIGRGKLDELNLRAMQLLADVLIFDRDLNPSQSRHIGEATNLEVLDRTQLILGIFAKRAQSADGKLQVELAQLKYLLPRLTQSDDSLSRLAGGIGGRGPGETKLEIDRRRVRERIAQLERRIDHLSSQRGVRRAQRNRRALPIISIVGYTNAGKSTLLNAITHSSVLAENALFATLDPTSRRLRFPEEREVIITDTVGFIRDLPKDLMNAFRATLEELADASLLLHVIDVASPTREAQKTAVERILEKLGFAEVPRLLVWNKADQVAPDELEQVLRTEGGVGISARDGEGLERLLEKADRTLFAERGPGTRALLAGIEAGP